MKSTIRFVTTLVLVFAFFIGSLPNALACGPFIISPIFSLNSHADFPLTGFTEGNPGIVPDTFGRRSLFVFYRQLNGLPLTGEEQAQVKRTISDKVFYNSGVNEAVYADGKPVMPDFLADWLKARAEIAADKRNIEIEKRIEDGYDYFSNCLPDAFRNAAATLRARIKQHGKDANVKEWLKGQDAVFANCAEAKSPPEPLIDQYPEWLRRDRAYQIGAAQFYIGLFPAARETFDKIAADDGSVWKATAKFVAARIFIRQSSFNASGRDEFLKNAAERLENILQDDSMKEFHGSAFRLLGLVKYRLIPDQRQKELDGLLVEPAENKNIYNDLTDFTWLLEKIASDAESKGSDIDAAEAAKENREYDHYYRLKLRDIPKTAIGGDLTDWLFTYEAADGFDHAFAKWNETRKPAWFVAAIGKADAKSGQLDEILDEAAKVKTDSPAFATVRYHQIRLLTESGKRDEARRVLGGMIGSGFSNLPLSSQNKFLAQRMSLAQNLGEFLKYAPRKAVIFDYDDTGREEGTSVKEDKFLGKWEDRTMFDADAVAFLNDKAPLSVLREAALSDELPDHLKKFLAVAVWMRAFILGNRAVEREFTPLVSRYAPEYAPLFAKYANAGTAANREAAALVFILRYPVVQPYVPFGYGREDSDPTSIDSIRGNWWCADEQGAGYSNYGNYDSAYPASFPDFLTNDQEQAAKLERLQLAELGDSATDLARRAVTFAGKYPRHRQTPEILHLAVRSTRYGCKDENTGRFSKQAFDLLHRKYRGSVWTRRTPYWFAQ